MYYNNKDNEIEIINFDWFIQKLEIESNLNKNYKVDLNNSVQLEKSLQVENNQQSEIKNN